MSSDSFPVGSPVYMVRVWLRGGILSLTHENVHPVDTLLTLDVTAPDELAVTLVRASDCLCVVAPPTTHDVTAVCPP